MSFIVKPTAAHPKLPKNALTQPKSTLMRPSNTLTLPSNTLMRPNVALTQPSNAR